MEILIPQDSRKISLQFQDWMENGNKDRPFSKHTARNYIREVNSFLDALGEIEIESLSEVNKFAIRMFISHIQKNAKIDKKTGKPKEIKSSTLSFKLSAIDTFFRFLIDEEIYDSLITPIEKYRGTRRGGRGARKEILTRDFLTEEEEKYLIETIRYRKHKNTTRDLALIGFVLDSGARAEEITDITIYEGMSLISGERINLYGKGKKERNIKPLAEYRHFLEDYLLEIETKDKLSPLFRTTHNSKFSQRSLYHLISSYLELAGIQKKQKGMHILRHTTATKMFRLGYSSVEVRDLLGHSSISTTNIYAH